MKESNACRQNLAKNPFEREIKNAIQFGIKNPEQSLYSNWSKGTITPNEKIQKISYLKAFAAMYVLSPAEIMSIHNEILKESFLPMELDLIFSLLSEKS